MSETFRGGGSVGPSRYFGYRGSWPLASLTVDYEAITFKLFPLTYRIERENIQHLVEDKILGFTHLRIIHSKSGFPKSITFSPFRFANLKETLSQYNYQTKSKEDVPEIERPNVKYSNTIAIIAVIAAGLGILAAIYAGFVGKHR